MTDAQKIAHTIMKQMRALDLNALMCIGARKYQTINNFNDRSGLVFMVSGLKFKGYVVVTLDYGTDTYVVDFCKKYKGKLNSKHNVTDVYVENLMNVIYSNCEVKFEG